MSQKTGRNPNRRLPAGHPERPARPERAERRAAPARVPLITRKPSQPPVAAQASWRNPLHALKDSLGILFDFEFNRYLTLQLLPLFYAVLLLVGLAGAVLQVKQAFAISSQHGLVILALTPLELLVWAFASRIITEFLIVAFRMAEDVRTLAGIRPAMDKLGDLLSGNSWLSKLASFMRAYQVSKEPRTSDPPETPKTTSTSANPTRPGVQP